VYGVHHCSAGWSSKVGPTSSVGRSIRQFDESPLEFTAVFIGDGDGETPILISILCKFSSDFGRMGGCILWGDEVFLILVTGGAGSGESEIRRWMFTMRWGMPPPPRRRPSW
jgi:hypothetical protein